VVTAFARLFAWKLSLHGVRASSTRQWVEKSWLHAINGHRDVGQTACPGRYLYARIPQIRTLAARYQRSWTARLRDTDLAGGSAPDLVVRDRATRRAYVIRTGGAGHPVSLTRTDVSFPHADLVLNAGDWDGDGHGDVITRSARSGRLFLFRGNGTGHFAAPRLLSRASFARVRMLSAVGDYTGDGRPDLLGQRVGWSMRVYPGRGLPGLRHSYVAHAPVSGSQQLGVGLWTGDGAPDSVVRRSNGALTLYPGNGPGGLTGGSRVGSIGPSYDWVLAVGDLTGDGRTDVVARGRASGRLYYFAGTSTGFGGRHALARGMGRFDLAG
jgi:hypothetical protein